MATIKKALNYVHNAGGNATPNSLMTDYAPVGHLLYNELLKEDFIERDKEEHLTLTEKGKKKREELNGTDS